MKQDWTYKRFDEIMKPAKVIKCGQRDNLPVLSITMHGGIVNQNERFGKSIASKDRSNYKVVKNGQLVIAFPIDEGLLYTQDVAPEGIMSPAYNIWDVDYIQIDRRFLVTYFHSSFAFAYYKAKLRGSTQRRRSMDRGDLLSMPIPVPQLSIQKKIVAELDLIKGVIEKQKTQLLELDNLGQSIFYDMFGDPTKNEKGWEIKQMIDVYKFIDYRGKTPNKTNHGIPLITAKNIRKGEIDYTIEEYISEEEYSQRQTRGIAQKGDILFTTEAPMGFAAIADKEIFSTGQRLITFQAKDNQVINNIFALYYILSENFQRELNRQATGSTVKGIKGSRLEKFPIQIPPLSLQKDFAEKMAIIERMKTKIRRNLKESEKLFNSRMEYYFN